MKKITYITALCLSIFIINTSAQIKVNSSGNVGINNSNPTYRLDVSGTSRFSYNGYSIEFSGTALRPISGNVDLGTSSSNYWYRLYATTAFFTYQPIIYSDAKFKSNIKDLSSINQKLQLIRPVTYDLNSNDSLHKIDPLVNKNQYGFIAQELQQVFPELVIQNENGDLGISYTALIPVLVQALKEQQSEIEALKKRLDAFEGKE